MALQHPLSSSDDARWPKECIDDGSTATAPCGDAAATAGGSGQPVSLVERVGEFLKVLALPALLDVSLLHLAQKLSWLSLTVSVVCRSWRPS